MYRGVFFNCPQLAKFGKNYIHNMSLLEAFLGKKQLGMLLKFLLLNHINIHWKIYLMIELIDFL